MRALTIAALLLVPASAWADLVASNATALKAAVATVGPSVVQIETTGGTDVLPAGPRSVVRKGVGPTTGVIVGSDGYVISSAFNFANKPASVFVSVPGRKERYVAQVVATDQSRMLTLLKIEASGLPVPQAAPTKDLRVGQWAVALGRTLDSVEQPPSVSVGIVSALGRIWGRALQTDAKISPVNYGGPLIDVRGHVIGILVPASPNAEGDTAGVEWYDSGIGFAIPMEHVFAIVPRLKEGKDLRRGLLGITPQSRDMYSTVPTIGTVAADSAAAKAGLRPGDIIRAVDGKKVVSHAQMMHALGPKYEGENVSLTIGRGGRDIDIEKITLTGQVTAFQHAFLGIVPLRDDPTAGVEVRYVFAKSPADKAGIKPGDRILKIAPASAMQMVDVKHRDQLAGLLEKLRPGQEIKLSVKAKLDGKAELVKLKLDTMSAVVPEAQLPLPGSAGKAKPVGKEKEPETGLVQRKNALGREFWFYVPENYDPGVAHAVVVWLHPSGKGRDPRDMIDIWLTACEDQHIILVGPKSANEGGWQASEAEFVESVVKEVMGEYTVDARRVVAHGMGVGGQLAYYLGFQARDLIRGVASIGAVLATQPKDNAANQPLSFFIIAGGKDPLAKQIAQAKPTLEEKKFPVTYREVAEIGREYLDFLTLRELARWIDSLDRL